MKVSIGVAVRRTGGGVFFYGGQLLWGFGGSGGERGGGRVVGFWRTEAEIVGFCEAETFG